LHFLSSQALSACTFSGRLLGLPLHKIGDSYFVEDGNHRVSVARYQGVETIEAEVTEFFPLLRYTQGADGVVG